MRLTLGRDWKLRNERGEVVGSVELDLAAVINTPDAGAEAGTPSVSEKGLRTSVSPPTSDPAMDVGPTRQETLALPEVPVARARAKSDPELGARIDRIWAHYCGVMEPRNKTLDPQTRQVIKDALKVADEAECTRAIDACYGSDYHMKRPGSGNDRRKYNTVSQILKGKRAKCTTRERIDFFLDMGEKSGARSGVPSGDPGRINAAKQNVRDAHEMPGDEHVATRGRESEEWLRTQGWTIDRDATGWPSFLPPRPT